MLFYLFSVFLGLFFLTFVFSYLFLTLWKFVKEKYDVFLLNMKMSDKNLLYYKKSLSLNYVIFVLYALFIYVLTLTVVDIIPQITSELWNFWEKFEEVKQNTAYFISAFDSRYWIAEKYNIDILKEVSDFFSSKVDVNTWVNSILKNIQTAWFVIFQVFLSLILSLIFIVDRAKMFKYLEWVKESNFSFFFHEYRIIFEKITKSFWLIFKAQSMIAFANAVLTSIWLFIIWLFYDSWFPFIHTLAVIVFICWFIPVFWTFISSLPILIIAFTVVWWFHAVLWVILLILVIHSIEAYYLNPKIVSSFMELPMSLTFIILIVSEHFFGIAWLIIWISMFYFIMDLVKDADKLITKWKDNLKEQDNIIDQTKLDIKKGVRMSRKVD